MKKLHFHLFVLFSLFFLANLLIEAQEIPSPENYLANDPACAAKEICQKAVSIHAEAIAKAKESQKAKQKGKKTKAAKLYRQTAKLLQMAVETYEKCYEQNRDCRCRGDLKDLLTLAAQFFKQSANCFMEIKEFKRAANAFKKAGRIYKQLGDRQNAERCQALAEHALEQQQDEVANEENDGEQDNENEAPANDKKGICTLKQLVGKVQYYSLKRGQRDMESLPSSASNIRLTPKNRRGNTLLLGDNKFNIGNLLLFPEGGKERIKKGDKIKLRLNIRPQCVCTKTKEKCESPRPKIKITQPNPERGATVKQNWVNNRTLEIEFYVPASLALEFIITGECKGCEKSSKYQGKVRLKFQRK